MEFAVDVRWMLTLLTIIICLNYKVAAICDETIVGNSTHNAAGEATSPGFPSLQKTSYSCRLEFEGTTSGEYLELIFTDFILDGRDTDACHGDPRNLHAVSIQGDTAQGKELHCERPKRQIIPVTQRVYVDLVSRRSHILQAYRVTYRFLTADEGDRLSRQTTHEVTGHNYDPRDNFQGSIKDEIDQTSRERWVDVVQYIKAPSGHRVALNAAFMQDHRTTTFEIHDGATSSSEKIAQESSSSSLGSVYKSRQEWIYIRWHGEASGGVALDIDFTFFKDPGSSGVCGGDYFKCTNNICIPDKLLCNGVDNCYDGDTSNDEDNQGECRAIVTQTPVPLQSVIFFPTVGIDPCDLEPCLEFALCISSVRSFYCKCPRYFIGYHCEKSAADKLNHTRTCRQDLCRNGGSCINNICVCQEGFTGTYCDMLGNGGTVGGKCAEECLNGGTCDADGRCKCAIGYFGPHCEYMDSGNGPDYTDLQHTSIMIGAFVGAVCLLSICWLIAMARKRQTDTQPEGRLQRIISVHSPEENGLRRQSTINVQSNVELPPNYSEACLFRDGSIVDRNKNGPRGSISSNQRISADEPLSPPPSYEIVAVDGDLDDDGGIVFRIPESVPEGDETETDDVDNGQQLNVLSSDQNSALPDVVSSQEGATDSSPTLTRHDTPV